MAGATPPTDAAPPDTKRARTMSLDAPIDGGAPAPPAIDEDLHSRQLAVYGRGAMARMAAAGVLICGLGGLGAEVGACGC